MLSPVSPSATGKTLRSLTSSLRASRLAYAAVTTRRKRWMLGSAMRRGESRPTAPGSEARAAVTGGPSGGLGDLVGLEAAGADVDAPGAAGLGDPDLLQVRLEAPLGGDHRVAPGLAERRSLAAAVTDPRHRGVNGSRQPSSRASSAVFITVSAAPRPWSRVSPPARASACSIVSQVITPKAQGTPLR